jgi:hypothetical protein
VLAYINRIKQHHPRNAAYEQMLRKNEQMYALLGLTVALCPAVQKGLDEHVLAGLKVGSLSQRGGVAGVSACMYGGVGGWVGEG